MAVSEWQRVGSFYNDSVYLEFGVNLNTNLVEAYRYFNSTPLPARATITSSVDGAVRIFNLSANTTPVLQQNIPTGQRVNADDYSIRFDYPV